MEGIMNDFDLYNSGMMNADEQDQWDYVTDMMTSCGECDGYDHAADQDAEFARHEDQCSAADAAEYEFNENLARLDRIELSGPTFAIVYDSEEILF